MSKKTVFIASSGNVKKQNLIQPVIDVLERNNFIPRPWYNEFKSGEIIIEDLLRIANEVDFAICIFFDDLKILTVKENFYSTAFNVVFEYGLFINCLGKSRVRIIHYNESKIPSDLDGVVVERVRRSGDLDEIEQIEISTEKIINQWINIPSLHNDKHGINKSIISYKRGLESTLSIIDAQYKSRGIKQSLIFNEELLVKLYINGLKSVEERFWTTTYLSSGFWSHKSREIINSNNDLLNRLSSKQDSNVRRLFLLKRDYEDELRTLRKKLVDYKNRKDGIKVFKEFQSNFYRLRNICNLFKENGCEIRFVHDSNSIYKELQSFISKDDTEIAIYDNFRIDFFDGGARRKITGLKTIASYHLDFRDILQSAERYFEFLWNEALDIDVLLEDYSEIFIYYEKKIDYTLKKLLDFDSDESTSDAILKSSEFEVVYEHLKLNLNSIKSYLDIGTCTGRYLLELKNILSEETIIYGIDSDPDCIDFTKLKLKIYKKLGRKTDNIFVLQKDILNPQLSIDFDNLNLITCMLGTLSHFGWDIRNDDNYNDDLQYALIKMKSLLSDSGQLILSNWSEIGLATKMLSIYSDTDRKLLRSGTVSKSELKKRLLELNLQFKIAQTKDRKLDIFICTKNNQDYR